MTFETLIQLTSAITIASYVLIILSILRHRTLFRYSFREFITNLKEYMAVYTRQLGLFAIVAIFFSLAYSSIDTSTHIAKQKSEELLGKYNYAYISNSVEPINEITTKQSESTKSPEDQISFIKNIAIDREPNITLLTSNEITNNSYFSIDNFNNKKDITIKGKVFHYTASDVNSDIQRFRYNLNATIESKITIFINFNDAKVLFPDAKPNIVFTKNKYNTSSENLLKDVSENQKGLYSRIITEINKKDFQNLYYDKVNPFNTLLFSSITVFILLIYPFYKVSKEIYNKNEINIKMLRSTGAPAGNITRYLTFFTIIPISILFILASVSGYIFSAVFLKVVGTSVIFGYAGTFIQNPLLFLYIFVHTFSLFFLVMFMVFFSSYRPKNRFRYAKISAFRLTAGITSILFGPVLLFFLKDLPPEAQGLIPILIIIAPTISLLGITIFLRLDNLKRRLVILASSTIFIIGNIILYFRGDFVQTPSSIFLAGMVATFLIAIVINEWSYKDFPRMLLSGLIIYILLFLVIIAPSGITLDTSKYDFNLSVQTYTAVDKINLPTVDPDFIVNKLTTARGYVITESNKIQYIAAKVDLISVPRSAIIAKNISSEDMNTFYNSKDLVILPPEFLNSQGIKEGDEIEVQEIVTRKPVIKKVFKIMEENTNFDISGKIIFPDLNSDFMSPSSSLNNILLLKIPSGKKAEILDRFHQANIFDIQDVTQKIETNRQSSAIFLQSLKILFIFIITVTIILTRTKDKIKGFGAAVITLLLTFGLGYIYELTIGSSFINETFIFLLIVFIFDIIIYGSDFAYRKFKSNK